MFSLSDRIPPMSKKGIEINELPKIKSSIYLNKRNQEEIIQIKAIQSLAYLRKEKIDQYLIDVMHNHESEAVKIATIDAFLWNHEDSQEAAKLLYATLPQNYHRFIGRIRFGKTMDKIEFNKHMKDIIDGGRK